MDLSASPAALVRSLWKNRHLVAQLTRREVIGRYRGSIGGLAWSFFNPLLMLAVYTFFFSVVFRARWGAEDAGKGAFATFLFVGILVHGIFAECMNRAPALILGNANLVKRVVFPLEILAVVVVASALFHAVVSLLVLLVAQLLLHAWPTPEALFFPLVILPLVFISLGVSWLLSALGVYFRDIGQITAILTTVMLFLSPVFYPISNMPEQYRPWMFLNPLTFIIEQSRSVLLLGQMPSWAGWSKMMVAAIVFAWVGFYSFQRARRGFADVL